MIARGLAHHGNGVGDGHGVGVVAKHGEVVFGVRFNFAYQLGSIVGGAILYQIAIAFVLQLGLSTEDMKLFSAITVAVALSIPTLQKKMARM